MQFNSMESWLSLWVFSFGVGVLSFCHQSVDFTSVLWWFNNILHTILFQVYAFAHLKQLTCLLKTENDCEIAKNLFP